MSTAELVLTETRLWARSTGTHWDTPPSIVLGSNGYDLVVGESLTPPTQVSSVPQYIGADRIALPPRSPATVEALAAVFDAVLAGLRASAPYEQVTVVCPTEWGPRRRGVVGEALRGFGARIVFEEMAVRAVDADEATGRSRRTVVLEFGGLSTTATAVIRNHEGTTVESCEHEPNLAPAELTSDTVAALLNRVLSGRPADLVQVLGVGDPLQLDLLRSAVRQVCGPAVELRALGGADLVRTPQPSPVRRTEPVPAMPDAEWMQSLRARAAAMEPADRRTPVLVGVVAALAVVAFVVVGVVVFLNRPGDEPTARPDGSATAADSTSEPVTTAAVPPSSVTATGPETFGRLRLQAPVGWHVANNPEQPDRTRIVLIPDDGARRRITVVQQAVAADAGDNEVAADLETQMRQRPTGSVSGLRRDAEFAGRPGIAYEEYPSDGSTVRWHVLVEHGLQVSVGCQYRADEWTAVQRGCEQVVRSLAVLP